MRAHLLKDYIPDKLSVAENQFASAASKKDNECLLLLNMRRKLISAVTFYYPTQMNRDVRHVFQVYENISVFSFTHFNLADIS